MKVKSITIKNFRSFKECTVSLNDYTSLVGANGAGKSTILCALNIFFREVEESPTDVANLDIEDFYERDVSEPIEITVVFHELSEPAKTDFAAYVRQGELIIMAKAEYDKNSGFAVVKQFGQRQGFEEFRNYFEMDKAGVPAADLKSEYEKLRSIYDSLPVAKTKPAMQAALWKYEEDNPENCVLIPSEDQFYGASKGKGLLNKYVQWIYVPAVKDAKTESVEGKNTAFGKILDRAVKSRMNFGDGLEKLRTKALDEYRELLETQSELLDEVSTSLTQRLGDWAHPDAVANLRWKDDPNTSIKVSDPEIQLFTRERNFEGNLARFGHGLQRSYLLALLQELASVDDSGAPKLIFGCEEPELYQHPPQSLHLASVLENLSTGNAQVIVSTHSPHFVCGRFFESLRMARYDYEQKQSCIFGSSFDTVADRLHELTGVRPDGVDVPMARLQRLLQPHVSEMFFAPRVVFVEGIEDEAYIKSLLAISGKWDEYRRYGTHIVRVDGKHNLLEPLVIAETLDIPTFVVFDADKENTKPENENTERGYNSSILNISGGDKNNPFPEETAWGERYVQWPNNITDTLKSEVDDGVWAAAVEEAGLELASTKFVPQKNPIRIGKLINILYDKHIPPSLTRLVDSILSFSKSSG